jgi:hypothetical protein
LCSHGADKSPIPAILSSLTITVFLIFSQRLLTFPMPDLRCAISVPYHASLQCLLLWSSPSTTTGFIKEQGVLRTMSRTTLSSVVAKSPQRCRREVRTHHSSPTSRSCFTGRAPRRYLKQWTSSGYFIQIPLVFPGTE